MWWSPAGWTPWLPSDITTLPVAHSPTNPNYFVSSEWIVLWVGEALARCTGVSVYVVSGLPCASSERLLLKHPELAQRGIRLGNLGAPAWVKRAVSRPGTPTSNPYVEVSNGRLHAESLSSNGSFLLRKPERR
jgi:hypothetical protein